LFGYIEIRHSVKALFEALLLLIEHQLPEASAIDDVARPERPDVLQRWATITVSIRPCALDESWRLS
jgi:hypothetical protein